MLPLPPTARARMYTVANNLFFRVFGDQGPGLVALDVARQPTIDAIAAEAKLRSDADAAEALARAQVDAGLTTSLADAVKAQTADTPRKMQRFSASLVVAAAISLSGKKVQTIAVNGIKAGDAVIVTPKAAVPTSFTIGEARASADNTIEIAVVFPTIVTLGAAQTVPLDIIALRS